MIDTIEILCKNCKCHRFIVIEPKKNLSEDSKYWWCTQCVRESNRERYSRDMNIPEQIRYKI